MADVALSTLATSAKEVKSLLNLLPEEKGRPKFGTIVDLDKESRCPYIEVFMACHGYRATGLLSDNVELRRGRFKPTDTALDARDAFAKERDRNVKQEYILDENGFILSESLLKMPMKTLSSSCRLNLNFAYSRNIVSGAVVKVKDEIEDAGKSVRDATTNTPSWWQSWRSSSSTQSSKDSE